MTARLVGTNAPGMLDTSAWLAEVAADPGATRVDVASAYWGAKLVVDSQALVATGAGEVRLLVWDLGGTKDRLLPVLEAAASDERLDLRFIGSTPDGGTFHPKVIGIRGADGTWTRALVGSANFTRNAQTRNVEVGVEVVDLEALQGLRAWFEAEFANALRAEDVDVDAALELLPDKPPPRAGGFAPASGTGVAAGTASPAEGPSELDYPINSSDLARLITRERATGTYEYPRILRDVRRRLTAYGCPRFQTFDGRGPYLVDREMAARVTRDIARDGV